MSGPLGREPLPGELPPGSVAGRREDPGPAVAIMIVTGLPLEETGHDHGLADTAPFRS